VKIVLYSRNANLMESEGNGHGSACMHTGYLLIGVAKNPERAGERRAHNQSGVERRVRSSSNFWQQDCRARHDVSGLEVEKYVH
jgi:hypothetical protein